MQPTFDAIERPQPIAERMFAEAKSPADTLAVRRRQPYRTSDPTLVIGVGGTGHLIANRIKRAFLTTRGTLPVNFETLEFDSAIDPVSSINDLTGEIVALETGSEFIQLAAVPVQGIKANLSRHKELTETMGEDAIQRITRAYITHGAAQDRTQGMLSFLWNGATVERRIIESLHRLTERDKDLNGAIDTSSTVQVYIAASVAGGQGAGAIQAIGTLVSNLMMRMSTLGERGRIVGLVVLPGAFHGIEGPRMQANTFATVEELNASMLGKVETRIHYPGGHPIRTNEPPFDYVYVFDGVDENGRTWPAHEDVCDLASRLVWLLSSSEVGTREINAMINQTGVLVNQTDGGYGTYVATAGYAAIRYPAQEVAERCAMRQARAVLGYVLQGLGEESGASLPGIRPPDAASMAVLREQLSANDEGMPYQPAMTVPAALEQLPLDEIPVKARLLVDNHMRRRIDEEILAAITRKKGQVLNATTAALGEALSGYLDAGRLREARTLLTAAAATLEAGLAEVAADLEQAAQLDEQIQFVLSSTASALEKASATLFTLNRKVQVRNALSAYLGEANALAAQRVDRKIAESIAEILRSLLMWTQQQQRALESGIARLHQAREVIVARNAEMNRREGSRTEISLADVDLVDALYARHANPAAVDAPAVLVDLGAPTTWMQARPQELAQRVVRSVLPSFEPVLRLTVEEVLSMRWNERSAQHWLTRLESLAAAGWNPDRALLRGGGVDLAAFTTIGVPDEARSIFGNSGQTLVSTHDPERIIVLRTVYGGSFDALKPFSQWKQAYDLLAPKHALHIYPGFRTTEDLSTQTFALGLIYGLVVKKGAWYYYVPSDKLAVSVQLAQGLENAIRAFRDRREVQDEARGRIETAMGQEGTARTAQRINGWIEAGAAAGSDETLLRLRRAAQEYLDRRGASPIAE